ncbi:TolC family outer membrane protein [Ideonella paludis]|nr:TolC family outer membrane protein [Ideonella paludis]
MAQNQAVVSAAQRAIETNPEVAAKFNALRASIAEVDVASGALLPRVDLSGDVGRTQDNVDNRRPSETQSLNRAGLALTVNQLLWDGLATSNEIKRLGHSKLARYFDFIDATEQTALEATRAFHDVERFRRLVKLAEDNYVQHKYAADQIQSRVRAGVARGVDLEQAGARLALAESNLVTEKANLHDVTERYRRVVGELPPASPGAAQPLARPLPASGAAALEATALNSPAIAAAVENLRATRAQAESRKGAFQPKVEARIRGGVGKNLDGTLDQTRDINAQLVLNWNLFNGGSDQARVRQSTNLLNQAMDLRDKACRDTRQTAAIAYNDVKKLSEQLAYLDRNVIAIEKARDAYRQQFDIGQRSLLDLLNAENELYTAKRAYAVADADLQVATVRTHAAMGTLVSALGLARADAKTLAPEGDNWAAGEDAATRCPLAPTDVATTSKDELDARARAMTGPAKAAPAPAAPAPATPVAATKKTVEEGLAEQRLRDWAAAWMSKDLTRYYSFYSPNFGPIKADKSKWQSERKRLVTKPGEISVVLENLVPKQISANRVETSFKQIYKSSNFNDTMLKTLTWERSGSEWLIVKESNR